MTSFDRHTHILESFEYDNEDKRLQIFEPFLRCLLTLHSRIHAFVIWAARHKNEVTKAGKKLCLEWFSMLIAVHGLS